MNSTMKRYGYSSTELPHLSNDQVQEVKDRIRRGIVEIFTDRVNIDMEFAGYLGGFIINVDTLSDCWNAVHHNVTRQVEDGNRFQIDTFIHYGNFAFLTVMYNEDYETDE